MELHDFEIEQFSNRGFGKIKIDGKEMHGVTYVNYENRVGDVPEITIRFMPGTLNFKDKNKTINTPSKEIKETLTLPHTHETHLEVKITDMETFKKVLGLLMDFVCDERVNKDLRYSYFGKLQKIKENNNYVLPN